MPPVTPSFVFDFESRLRRISENEYTRLASAKTQWWDKVARVMPSMSKRELVTWFLNTAQIEDQGQGGNISFEDLVMLQTEYRHSFAGKGLKIRRAEFEDLDGNGIQVATEWTQQISAHAAYWPQKQVANLIKNGHLATSLAYDGQPFFSASHPLNPFDPGAGTYSNLFTGGTACDVSTAVTLDVAIQNLAKVYAAIAAIKMPNGVDPRGLRPAGFLCSPLLMPRLVQLTNAKFIAMAAAGGAGSADLSGVIESMSFGTPTQADELAGYESDTTFFVIAEQMASSQLGSLLYLEREPFSIRYYTGRGGGTGVDAILDRADELEWHTSGRNGTAYGHPYLLFKVKAA